MAYGVDWKSVWGDVNMATNGLTFPGAAKIFLKKFDLSL
jgi:hypothetical protein